MFETPERVSSQSPRHTTRFMSSDLSMSVACVHAGMHACACLSLIMSVIEVVMTHKDMPDHGFSQLWVVTCKCYNVVLENYNVIFITFSIGCSKK